MDTWDDEGLPTPARPPLEFRLGSRPVAVQNAALLDERRTVYRLDLRQPPCPLALAKRLLSLCPRIMSRWPGWFLPPTVIIKKRKPGWEDEFDMEKRAYKALKRLQGAVIPHYYGEAVYDGSPALVLSFIPGKTLFETWQDLEDGDLRLNLEAALRPLTSSGVHYTDVKLDNFMRADDGRVVVIDLEQVELNTTTE
ncbi:hypothetical protein C8A05DRAFT_31280 [Staphylotrichum tortipilum]|uniref:Protein kinase domain-containing protein n=1 Tax=Staphylotrichum tortipilum TaxID=2831512 RepID=A0AAN6RVF3_9PEZI|nr:hypothetical protein C8A05DRAFT_31280 [Staphylotrichum longicolle]